VTTSCLISCVTHLVSYKTYLVSLGARFTRDTSSFSLEASHFSRDVSCFSLDASHFSRESLKRLVWNILLASIKQLLHMCSVPLKFKLPPLVSFLAWCISFLTRHVLFLLRRVSIKTHLVSLEIHLVSLKTCLVSLEIHLVSLENQWSVLYGVYYLQE